MSLIIYNKSPKESCLNLIKRFILSFLGVRRGPSCVTKSLLTGLDELGVSYKFNPDLKEVTKDDIIYVNESIDALKWAIEAKKRGYYKTLITGPAISVLPDENNSLMLDRNIDLILQPADWVKSMWEAQNREIASKIRVWWAGVNTTKPSIKKDIILLYIKDAPQEIIEYIESVLKRRGIIYKIIKYGHYRQSDYFKLLEEVKGAIFLSKSESQGLALTEAWMKDVPTLVWSVGKWEYKNVVWNESKVSAPYLNEKNGLFFTSTDDFELKLEQFINKLVEFSAREDALLRFTYKICAKKFLELIKK